MQEQLREMGLLDALKVQLANLDRKVLAEASNWSDSMKEKIRKEEGTGALAWFSSSNDHHEVTRSLCNRMTMVVAGLLKTSHEAMQAGALANINLSPDELEDIVCEMERAADVSAGGVSIRHL